MAQVAQLLDDQLGNNIDFVDINCGEWWTVGLLDFPGTHRGGGGGGLSVQMSTRPKSVRDSFDFVGLVDNWG